MGHQLPKRDRCLRAGGVADRKREVVTDVVVEIEAPLVVQDQGGGHRDRLGDGGPLEQRVRRDGALRLDVGPAREGRAHQLAVDDDPRRQAGHLQTLEFRGQVHAARGNAIWSAGLRAVGLRVGVPGLRARHPTVGFVVHRSIVRTPQRQAGQRERECSPQPSVGEGRPATSESAGRGERQGELHDRHLR